MLRFISILVAILVSAIARAEPQSTYIAEFSCIGGPLGLRLPDQLPAVMKLGPVTRVEVLDVEKWEGYTTTRKYIYFSGLTLGVITFSNNPKKYMVSFAEITSAQWSHIAPFQVGELVTTANRKIGPSANGDLHLKASYGSEAGDLSIDSSGGRIGKVTYACYTG